MRSLRAGLVAMTVFWGSFAVFLLVTRVVVAAS
jgi:hypothetical protein